MNLRTSLGRLLSAVLALACVASLLPLSDEFRDRGATLEQLLPPEEVVRIQEELDGFDEGVELLSILLVGEDSSWSDERVVPVEQGLVALPDVLDTRRLEPAPGATLILAFLTVEANELARANVLVARVGEILEAARHPGDWTGFIGTPRLRVESWRMARQDFLGLLPLLFLLVVGVPWLLLGNAGAGLFALLLAAGTTSLTLWAHQFRVGQASPTLLLIVPLVWSVASMDALHLHARAIAWLETGLSAPSAVRRARRELLAPCLVTTLTTAVGLVAVGGFGSSGWVQEFGQWAALGVVGAYVLTFLLGPLFWIGPLARGRRPRWPLRWARRWTASACRRPGGWLLIWSAGLALSLAGAFQLRAASDFPRVFASHVPVAQELEELGQRLDFDLAPLDLILHSEEAGDHRVGPLLHAGAALARELGSWPEVVRVLPFDLVGEASSMEALDLPPHPDEREARLREWVESEELAAWIRPDQGVARLQVHLRAMDQGQKRAFFERVDHLDRTLLGRHRIGRAGSGHVLFRAEELGLETLRSGSLTLLLALVGILGVGLRHVRRTFAALVASLLPLLVVAGFMGGAGLPWSLPLLPLPGVLLGIAVDDSVHLLWRGRRGGLARRHPAELSAVLASTLLVAACMTTLAGTSVASGQHLGLLLALGLVMALAADLSLLPILARGRFRRSRRRGSRSPR